MKLVKLYFLPWFTPQPARPGTPAPHEFPAVRSLSAIGSPFLACAHDAIPFRTYAVAESTGSLTQGRTALLTAQAGLCLGNKLCAKWGKSADSGREAAFFIPNRFCAPSAHKLRCDL